jgi:serralysin
MSLTSVECREKKFHLVEAFMQKHHWWIGAQDDNSFDWIAPPDLLLKAGGVGILNFQHQSYFSNGIGPSPIIGSPAYFAEAGQAAPIVAKAAAASSVLVTNGGMTFNLQFDAASSANTAAAAAFRTGIEQAASLLSAVITDKITVNIAITYSGTGGGASAGPSGYYESYSSIRSDLINNASSGDAIFNSLPTGSIQGQTSIAVWDAELKVWGLLGANDRTTADGSATFATDISSNALVGVALHELTHALGRVPYGTAPDIFDLFRFTATGTRLFSGSIPAPAAYFSLDGGHTILANYGLNSDPSDFLNSGVQGVNDPFNEYYTPGATLQNLTQVDLQQLDALGFHIASSTPPPTTYSVSAFLGLTPPISPAVSISDSSNAVTGALDSLQSEVSYIANISLTDTSSISISPTQSATDNAVLSKITGAYNLTVTGTSGSETFEDTANSVSSLIGGTGTDTFIVSGKATITNFGGADILQVASGGTANVTEATAWTASSSTSNSGTVNITANGLAVNLSAAGGPDGYTVTDTSTSGHVALTGSGYADTLIAANGDTLTGGGGIDNFVVGSADTVAITDLGNGGADILNVSSGGVANATVTAAWTASSSTSNSGTVNITTNGLAVNLSAAGGPDGYTVTDASTSGHVTLIGSGYADTLIAANGDTLTGGGGIDNFVVGSADTVAITDLGNGGADILNVSSGGVANATVAVAWTASSSTSNSGTVNITTNGLAVNLSAAGGPHGYSVTNGSGTGTTLTGSAYNDTLTGGSGNDTLNGGGGNDTIIGGKGADILTGGTGSDTFVFVAGDSGQSTGFDTITDYTKGAVGMGDVIDYVTAVMRIGGSSASATGFGSAQASINQTTGVATFATIFFTDNLANDLAAIANRFHAVGDAAGEFAFFKVGKTGSYYLFISDGVAGVTANDEVVQLTGVTSISSLNIDTTNHLLILTA